VSVVTAGIPKDRGIRDEMPPGYINFTPVLVPSMRLHVRIRRSGALHIHLFDKLRTPDESAVAAQSD